MAGAMGLARVAIEGLLRSFRARSCLVRYPGNRSLRSLIPGLGSLGLSGPNTVGPFRPDAEDTTLSGVLFLRLYLGLFQSAA
jgi:hypothetical protein